MRMCWRKHRNMQFVSGIRALAVLVEPSMAAPILVELLVNAPKFKSPKGGTLR